MPKFKVWNDNSYAHKETFKGDVIDIKAGKYVLMEEDDAIMFRGQFFAPVLDGDGQPKPESYKKIRLELFEASEAIDHKADAHVCQACKYKAVSEKDLSEHIEVTHKDSVLVDEDAEQELKLKKKAKAG
jgi:hypothetical protein